MHLVVGLGNPGAEYAGTYHNLGFLAVDRLAEEHSIRVTRPDSRALVGGGEIEGCPVMLAKPQTWMNLSGACVKPLMDKHSFTAADLILIYDELDLPWTGLRIKLKGSSAGHNGAESVIRSLGTNEFVRVRMGIHPGHPIRDGAVYVLSPIKRQLLEELDEFAGYAAGAVRSIITEGVDKAMTKFNRPDSTRRAQGSTTEEA
jgi:PTH1 family peptidyl-tRNA hydrolase